MNIYIYFFFVITYFLIQYLDIHGPLARGGGGYPPIAPLALQAGKGIFCCFENISKGSVCIVSPFEPFCE